MSSDMNIRSVLVIATVFMLPLVVGSQCAFFFSSGGGSSNKDDKNKNNDQIIVVKNGSFESPAVQGINYESGSISGITGKHGEFQYEAGNSVRFFIGDIILGTAEKGKPVISPSDLVAAGKGDTSAAINMARLLRSLDADPEDDVVTIPKTVRAVAVRSNASVSAAIEFLDFSDEVVFVNAASQLVAALTVNYPHTATLLDGDSAQSGAIRSPETASAP